MKYAITAANGQLGRAIIEQLKRHRDAADLIGLARTPAKAADLGITIRPGDYNDATVLRQSLEGVDAMILISGMDAPDTRIGQHRNVIEAARQAGVGKLVYVSIVGQSAGSGFAPVIDSNRQTESDVQASGLDWVIGRNGLYIEADIEYLETYKQLGAIINCAATGLCSYTTRTELAYAYTQLLLGEQHNSGIYELAGAAISQQQLADFMNQAFGTALSYRSISVDAYRAERVQALGDYIGTIIAGIYEAIRLGHLLVESDYARAAGREHVGWETYFTDLSRLG